MSAEAAKIESMKTHNGDGCIVEERRERKDIVNQKRSALESEGMRRG